MTDNQLDTKFADWRDALITKFKLSPHLDKLINEVKYPDFDVVLSWHKGFFNSFHQLYPEWVNETWSEEQTLAAAHGILEEAFMQGESLMFDDIGLILNAFIPFLVQEGVCTEGVDWSEKIKDLMKTIQTDEESIHMRDTIARVREEGLEEGYDFDVEGAFDDYLHKWLKREQLLDELAEIAKTNQAKANALVDALPEEEQAFLMKKMMSEWEQNFDPKNGEKALEKLLKKTNGYLPKEGEAFEKAVKKHLTTQEQIDLGMMLSKFGKEERAQGRDPHVYEGDDDDEEGYWHKSETVRRQEPKTGRNDPCPCGSGKKYKKCHGK